MGRRIALALVLGVAAAAAACAVGTTGDEDAGGNDAGSTPDAPSGNDVAPKPDASTCAAPLIHCLGAEAGACTDLTSDPNHCGTCGTECTTSDGGDLEAGNGNPDAGLPPIDGGPDAGNGPFWSLGTAACKSSQCAIDCPQSMTLCSDGVCYDTQNYHDHCGTCATACQPDEYCAGGHCCASGTLYCNGTCVDVLSDTANCGGCGNACGSTLSCVNGQCATCSNANVALTATPSSSGGGSGTYGPADMNDGTLETTSCTYFEWTNGGSSPGTDWVQYTWSTAKKLVKMHIDTTGTSVNACGYGRALGGAQIQWWNGSSWVTDGTVSGQTNDWDYTFTSQITTTQLRLYGVYAAPTSAQATNPIIYEWQVTGCN